MDARSHAIHEQRWRWGYRFFLTFLAFIVAGSVFQAYKPTEVKTKTVTKTVTETKRVPVPGPTKTVYKTKLIPLPHKNDPPVGSMTVEEFRSIQKGMSVEYVEDTFGYPAGNVANDHKTFYPAAEGGTYWVYFDKGLDPDTLYDEATKCYNQYDNGDRDDVEACDALEEKADNGVSVAQGVIRKEYIRE